MAICMVSGSLRAIVPVCLENPRVMPLDGSTAASERANAARTEAVAANLFPEALEATCCKCSGGLLR